VSTGSGQGGSAFPKSVQAGIPKINNPAGWPTPKIGALLKVVQRPVRLEKTKEYRLVTARRSRGGIVRRETLLGKDIATPSQFEIAEGDFLISRRQIAHGACGIVPSELAGSIVSNEYATLRPTSALHPGFLKHLTASIYFQQTCFHSSIGVHVEKLVFDLQGWLRWPIAVPEPPEQRRIAAVLDAWDEAIATAQAHIEAKLRAEKAIFSALRRTWPESEFASYGRLIGGGTPSKGNPDFWNGTIPWVSSKDMGDGVLTSTVDQITEAALSASTTKLVPKNSVLMVVRSGILRHTFPVALASKPVAINQDIKALIPSKSYDGFLLSRIIRLVSEDIRRLAMKTGTTVESIDVEALRDFPLPYPPESSRAATSGILSALQVEITCLEESLVALRTQKRGLMQKLLTGQWPVPESIDALLATASEVTV
jgi:type I restriction enzyme S subunit